MPKCRRFFGLRQMMGARAGANALSQADISSRHSEGRGCGYLRLLFLAQRRRFWGQNGAEMGDLDGSSGGRMAVEVCVDIAFGSSVYFDK